MEENFYNVTDKFASHSHIVLTEWGVSRALKDMRYQFKQLMKIFKLETSFLHCAENLEEAIIVTIDLYERIQNYQQQKELANYIESTINFEAANSLNTEDPAIYSAFGYLEEEINASLALNKYAVAKNALRQYVFPFAQFYIDELTLPSNSKLKNDFKILFNTAINQVNNINSKVKEFRTSINNQFDGFIMKAHFNRGYISTKPFFVWENRTHKDVIFKLLSGEKVALKADVLKSDDDKDVIKLIEIGMNFIALDAASQTELKNSLKKYMINATHLGNSSYKFHNNIYLIKSNSQKIVFSFEKDTNGKPLHKNNVYCKIETGNMMLSPYAMWEIQLINSSKMNDFDELKMFNGKVDLELVGYASYLTGKININKTDMDVYYSNEHDHDISAFLSEDEDELTTSSAA